MDRTRRSFLQGALLSAGVLAARGAAGAQDRKDTMKMPIVIVLFGILHHPSGRGFEHHGH